MSRTAAPQIAPAPTTRDRILEAAILRFSRCSYEETGLRDIAADVGVDVAYVHRCFGSKQQLFAGAVKASLRPDRIFTNMTESPADTLAIQVFAQNPVGSRDEVGPLDILMHSLSSPEAASVLREFILQDFAQPLSRHLNTTLPQAVLITAFLTGVSIFRNVLLIADLRKAEDQLKAIIAHVIEDTANKDIVPDQRHRAKRTGPENGARTRSSGKTGLRAKQDGR